MGIQDSGASPAEEGTALTAYASDGAMLRRRLAPGTVDARSFQRPVSRCEISQCPGMCCYDGVYVSEEAAAVITALAERHADFFAGPACHAEPHWSILLLRPGVPEEAMVDPW